MHRVENGETIRAVVRWQQYVLNNAASYNKLTDIAVPTDDDNTDFWYAKVLFIFKCQLWEKDAFGATSRVVHSLAFVHWYYDDTPRNVCPIIRSRKLTFSTSVSHGLTRHHYGVIDTNSVARVVHIVPNFVLDPAYNYFLCDTMFDGVIQV